MTRVTAIVPAAGSSTRMGGVAAKAGSKALIEIAGKKVIEWTLAALTSDTRIGEVIVLIRDTEKERFAFLEESFPVRLSAGGETRTGSVRCGVELATAAEPKPDLLLVHDAARCLLSSELVARLIDGALIHRAVTAAVPVVDTLARADKSENIQEYTSREGLWQIQTPQVFKTSLLEQAYRKRSSESTATDDSSLVVQIANVKLVRGESTNRKLTVPEDIRVAEAVLQIRRGAVVSDGPLVRET